MIYIFTLSLACKSEIVLYVSCGTDTLPLDGLDECFKDFNERSNLSYAPPGTVVQKQPGLRLSNASDGGDDGECFCSQENVYPLY